MQKSVIHTPKAFRDLWDLIVLVSLATICGVIAFWMLSTQYYILPGSQGTDDPLGVSQIEFTEETGIQIVRVNVSLGGGAVAIRYQVIDPDKAVIIHDERYPPTVVNEDTGQILNIPWHEHSHDRDLHAGIIYFELIKNSGGALKPDNKVSVIIGESRLEHIVVQ